MTVDFYWRRVSGAAPADSSPCRLRKAVPHWSEEEFGALRDAGRLMVVERNHPMMDFLLKDGGVHDAEPNALPVFGGERRTERVGNEPGSGGSGDGEEVDIWVLDPPRVRAAAAFLEAFPVEERLRALEAELAEEVRAMYFAEPWEGNDKWQAEVAEDVRRLTAFLAAAAEVGDAVVKVEEG